MPFPFLVLYRRASSSVFAVGCGRRRRSHVPRKMRPVRAIRAGVRFRTAELLSLPRGAPNLLPSRTEEGKGAGTRPEVVSALVSGGRPGRVGIEPGLRFLAHISRGCSEHRLCAVASVTRSHVAASILYTIPRMSPTTLRFGPVWLAGLSRGSCGDTPLFAAAYFV